MNKLLIRNKNKIKKKIFTFWEPHEKIYGGIWFDADTIITDGSFLKKLEDYELVMIGDEKSKTQHNR